MEMRNANNNFTETSIIHLVPKLRQCTKKGHLRLANTNTKTHLCIGLFQKHRRNAIDDGRRTIQVLQHTSTS